MIKSFLLVVGCSYSRLINQPVVYAGGGWWMSRPPNSEMTNHSFEDDGAR